MILLIIIYYSMIKNLDLSEIFQQTYITVEQTLNVV